MDMMEGTDILLDLLGNADEWLDSMTDEDTTGKVKLSTLDPGTEFYIGRDAYIVLETNENVAKVLQRDFCPYEMEFGASADWKESPIREKLNGEYFARLAEMIGEYRIIPFHRDLTSLDGLDDYGGCVDKISLLSTAEYAKYHRILGLSRNPKWWWTITPFSTPNLGYSRCVCYVYSGGTLDWDGCGRCRGVRPFFSLDSSLLVSLVHEANTTE